MKLGPFLSILTLLCSLEFFGPVHVFASNASFPKCVREKVSSKLHTPQVVTLFNGDKTVADYNKVVRSIRPGDQIKLGNGTTFKVQQLISGNGTTMIYDLGDGWLLRVPSYEHKGFGYADGIPFIRDFQEMQPELKRNGIPVVEIDAKRGVPNQAVVVKVEPILFTLEDYLQGQDSNGEKLKLKDNERKEIEKKAVQFARKTWMYKYIGDFDASQLVYNGKDWILLDFGVNNGAFNSHLIENLKEKLNTFSHFSLEPLAQGKQSKAPKDMNRFYRDFHQQRRERRKIELRLYEKINEAISDERKKQRKHPELFQQIKDSGTYVREEGQ